MQQQDGVFGGQRNVGRLAGLECRELATAAGDQKYRKKPHDNGEDHFLKTFPIHPHDARRRQKAHVQTYSSIIGCESKLLSCMRRPELGKSGLAVRNWPFANRRTTLFLMIHTFMMHNAVARAV